IWPELEQVMLRALNRKPADRYANAASFAEALQDALLVHEIELIEPASAVKPSYIKFRLSQPPLKSGNGLSIGQGSAEAPASPDPGDPPPVPMVDDPPAGNSPRWPSSSQPRNAVPASAALDGSEQETLTRGAPVVTTGSPELRQPIRSEPLSLPVRIDGLQG